MCDHAMRFSLAKTSAHILIIYTKPSKYYRLKFELLVIIYLFSCQMSEYLVNNLYVIHRNLAKIKVDELMMQANQFS